MPVDFLTREQEARYGRFTGEPSEAELAQYFYLDARDWDLLGGRRGDHNRLGLVAQLTSVRYLGAFPDALAGIPATVVTYLARQLQLEPGDWVDRYEQTKTRHLHVAEIRATYGYQDFSEAAAAFPLVRFLYARAWLSAERPGALFDAAVVWLKTHRVLLPGITVLERLVAQVRDRVAERVWQQLTRVLSPPHQATLETLLLATEESRQTPLDRLRRAPTRYSAPALLQALDRLEEIRTLGVGNLDLSAIPPRRLKVLANFALTAKAQTIRRMRADRRAATLLALVRSLEMSAHDDALDVLDLLLADLFARVERMGKQERLRTLGDLDEAALTLAEITARLLSPKWGKARRATYLNEKRPKLEAAITRIRQLARPADAHYEEELLARYTAVRRFLPSVLRTIAFAGAPAGQPVLAALAFLSGLEGQKKPSMQDVPLACVPARWRRYVTPKGQGIDRKAYTLCVVEQVREELHRRNLFGL